MLVCTRSTLQFCPRERVPAGYHRAVLFECRAIEPDGQRRWRLLFRRRENLRRRAMRFIYAAVLLASICFARTSPTAHRAGRLQYLRFVLLIVASIDHHPNCQNVRRPIGEAIRTKRAGPDAESTAGPASPAENLDPGKQHEPNKRLIRGSRAIGLRTRADYRQSPQPTLDFGPAAHCDAAESAGYMAASAVTKN
jgi:hypothetical protein